MAKALLEIQITKEGNTLELYIKAPKKVEDYYKTVAVGEQTSQTWFDAKTDKNGTLSGVAFYKMTEDFLSAEKHLLGDFGHRVYSDFGYKLIGSEGEYRDAINIAMLRAKGLSDGIVFRSSNFTHGAMELEKYVQRLAIALKDLIKQQIGKKTIKATITYEI